MNPPTWRHRRVPCPFCAELVLPGARKCRYCKEWFSAPSSRETTPHPALGMMALRDIGEFKGRARVWGDDDDLAHRPSIEPDELADFMLRIDAISLEVCPELARLADPQVNGELLTRLKDVRRHIAREFGVFAPGVRLRPNPDLERGEYQIRVKGDLVAEGHVYTSHVLGIGADLEVPDVDVEYATDPIYGMPAVWIPAKHANLGEQQGLQVFDTQDIVSKHVSVVLEQHLAELLTREEVAELLNMARQDSPMVVQELVPNMLSLGQVRQVLQNLVRERVPINDMSTILNALADNAIYTKDPHALTEHVRAALGRKICARYQSQDGMLRAFMLSPEAERAIQGAIQLNESGQVLMLDPQTSQSIQNNLGTALAEHHEQILDPVIITPPKIRRHVKALLERNFAKIVVLSYSEIVPGVQIESLATIDAGGVPMRPPASEWIEPEGNGWLGEPVAETDVSADSDDTGDDAMDWNW